jgi:hypothetical protein
LGSFALSDLALLLAFLDLDLKLVCVRDVRFRNTLLSGGRALYDPTRSWSVSPRVYGW